jgi:adenylylsulfate kinase-like enzyme
MVIWLTGLSGAGKTTLARAIQRRVAQFAPVALLDGDAVRAAINDDLGYAEADRVVQIGRLGRLARLLADQGIVVVVAAVYSNPELIAWNRANLPGYLEVHVTAPLERLIADHTRDLYGRALRGEASNVVGIDIAWQPPTNPDLVVDRQRGEPADEVAARIVARLALPAPDGTPPWAGSGS